MRPAHGRVYQEVHYEPGQAMQVVWGSCGRVQIGQTQRPVSVFVAVLCYSRWCYKESDKGPVVWEVKWARFYRQTSERPSG